jgi:6-pyruvoyltetrahydropterin/6-carboxytetrahydropterin synthase
MYLLRVQGNFSSAHNLRGYKGKCEEVHGHNWKVEAEVGGSSVDKTGMLVDFKILKTRLQEVLEKLDHKHLNLTSYFKDINPSSEHIAKFIYEQLKPKTPGLKSVIVWENENSSAAYYED